MRKKKDSEDDGSGLSGFADGEHDDSDTDNEESNSSSNYLPPSLRVPENYSPSSSPTRSFLKKTDSESSSSGWSSEESSDISDEDQPDLSSVFKDSELVEVIVADEVEREDSGGVAEILGAAGHGIDGTDEPTRSESNDMNEHNEQVLEGPQTQDQDEDEETSEKDDTQQKEQNPSEQQVNEKSPKENSKENDESGECSVDETVTQDNVIAPLDNAEVMPLQDAKDPHNNVDPPKLDRTEPSTSKEESSSITKPLPQATSTSTTATDSTSDNSDNERIRAPQRSILRSTSLDRATNNNNDSNTFHDAQPVRKAVSFADENGGIISEQQTIDVSPSKLSRRVRRGSKAVNNNDDEDDEMVQKGVMGRVLVLLMDPPSKQYELTSLPYPLVSNENGIVGPTQLKALLQLVAKSASFEPLRDKKYIGFMRPDDVEAMDNDGNILDNKIIKDEVLVAIPEGYGVDACSKFSYPILQDKRLLKLLKKLKKHERKVEKRRRLKGLGMKPNRSGTSSRASSSVLAGGGEDKHDVDSRKKRSTTRGGIGTIHFDNVSDMDMADEYGENDIINWSAVLFGATVILILVSLLAGSASVLHQKKLNDSLQSMGIGMGMSSTKEGEKLCGRNMFCKPFGVKNSEAGSEQRKERVFIKKLKEGIRKWNLEGDDLML